MGEDTTIIELAIYSIFAFALTAIVLGYIMLVAVVARLLFM
jgi:hypothetical protein